MSNFCNTCNNCNSSIIFPYRVVQTMYERNTIPCPERINGMIVTVIGDDLTYKQYMLQGGDLCNNNNWEDYNLPSTYAELYGHVTLTEPLLGPIDNDYLNARYPLALEGFKVSVPALNTTFMKIFNNTWMMSNNTQL